MENRDTILANRNKIGVISLMRFQDFANSRLAIAIVLTLGRIIPPAVGYPLGEWIARRIASLKKNRMVQAVRANQWVVSRQTMNDRQLDEITRRTFEHTADCLYDLYHNLPYPQKIMEMVSMSPKLIRTLDGRQNAGKGTIILAPHLSNFDLAGRAMTLHGYPILVLSYPQPPGGYQWQNKMRQDFGIEILPMSFESLRAARDRLKNNGLVLTGMDRPMDFSNHQPRFFGYPAAVPVTYINLAAQTGADFVVVACRSIARGRYVAECSHIIPFSPMADKNQEYLENAETLLKEAEKMIQVAPEQWSMFYPVWPWALESMP
jgi:lauroyl/myristoyl acyltransferase